MFSIFYWTFTLSTFIIMFILLFSAKKEIKEYFESQNLKPKSRHSSSDALISILLLLFFVFFPFIHTGILFLIVTNYDELKRSIVDLTIEELL